SDRTKRGIQVAVPDEPKSCSPAIVASARSGPPENCVISTFRFLFMKNPRSAATHHDVKEGSTPTPTRTASCATVLPLESASKNAATVIAWSRPGATRSRLIFMYIVVPPWIEWEMCRPGKDKCADGGVERNLTVTFPAWPCHCVAHASRT